MPLHVTPAVIRNHYNQESYSIYLLNDIIYFTRYLVDKPTLILALLPYYLTTIHIMNDRVCTKQFDKGGQLLEKHNIQLCTSLLLSNYGFKNKLQVRKGHYLQENNVIGIFWYRLCPANVRHSQLVVWGIRTNDKQSNPNRHHISHLLGRQLLPTIQHKM